MWHSLIKSISIITKQKKAHSQQVSEKRNSEKNDRIKMQFLMITCASMSISAWKVIASKMNCDKSIFASLKFAVTQFVLMHVNGCQCTNINSNISASAQRLRTKYPKFIYQAIFIIFTRCSVICNWLCCCLCIRMKYEWKYCWTKYETVIYVAISLGDNIPVVKKDDGEMKQIM